MYNATVCKLTNVEKHPNADKLMIARASGAQVIVGLNSKNGDTGIFFPAGGKLSEAFCKANDLVGEKKMFDEKRRVKCIRLRGSVSEGFFIPLDSLKFIDLDLTGLTDGLEFTHYKDNLICEKYVAPSDIKQFKQQKGGRPSKKHPLFKEHFDTSHLIKNIHSLVPTDTVIITLKMHGTSQRLMSAPINTNYGWLKKTLCKLIGVKPSTTDRKVLLGTRRVEIGGVEDNGKQDNHYYRRKMARQIADKLRMGETVYSEIVGYEHTGKPIMNPISANKLGKEYQSYKNQENGSMHFKYGNDAGECSQYVYRITQTDEHGKCYDLSWNQVKKRCIELGVNHVPELAVLYLDGTNNEQVMIKAEFLAYGRDAIDSSHIREGVVVRIENSFGITCFKHKSLDFRILEDTVAEEANTEDLA